MCALESHVKQALSSPGRIISPSYLVKNLRCIARSFQMWRQEDAHEYLRYLIEALQKCCRSVEGSGGPSLGSQKNFIHRIFGGRLRSQVKCSQCSYFSNTYDPFLDLSLEIVRAESLLRAMARFTAVEVLDGGNKYHCSRCKAKVRALKQFTIDQLPHVLTIQFKRFSSSGLFGGKIDKKVHFDRTLDMKPFVNGGEAEGEDLIYSLYAVLVHSGWSTHSGHYYCFVRTGMDMWHILDDGRVSQVSEKTVLEQKAYILFYIRNNKQSPVSDSNDQKGNGKGFSNGTKFQVNGTLRMREVSGKDTSTNANATLNTDGNVKAVSSNAASVSDNLLRVSGISTSTNANASLNTGGNVRVLNSSNAVSLFGVSGISTSRSANTTLDTDGNVKDFKRSNAVGVSNSLLGVSCASTCTNVNATLDTDGNVKAFKSSNGVGVSDSLLCPAVPRWSEEDGGKGNNMEAHKFPDNTTAHCGYVLDEWDEEYDRGKRKKVRNKSEEKESLIGGTEETHHHKKLKKIGHKMAEQTLSLGNHDWLGDGNLFQAVAGSKPQVSNQRLKKFKTRRRALGYKIFLKKHLFRHL